MKATVTVMLARRLDMSLRQTLSTTKHLYIDDVQAILGLALPFGSKTPYSFSQRKEYRRQGEHIPCGGMNHIDDFTISMDWEMKIGFVSGMEGGIHLVYSLTSIKSRV